MPAASEADELATAWRALRDDRDEGGMRTIALGIGTTGFRAGMRFPGREEMLQAGFNLVDPPKNAGLPEGLGFRIELSADRAHGHACWISLTRQPGASLDLFALMAADLYRSASALALKQDDVRLATMLRRVRMWQDFMKRPSDRVLGEDEETGLFGELCVLRQLLAAGIAPGTVIGSWEGPNRAPQDFQTAAHGLEVKSTVSPIGFPACISSLDQLDPGQGRTILLAAMRLSEREEGQLLPELAAEVREMISGNPGAAADYDRKLILAGLSPLALDRYSRRMSPTDLRVFAVDAGFPRLARSATTPEIISATYDMDLDLLKGAPVTLSVALDQLGLFQP